MTQSAGSTAASSNAATADASASTPPVQNAPVTPSRTVSSAPPALIDTTGRPAAWASTAAMPNSSTAGAINARQPWSSSAASTSVTRPAKLTFGLARRRSRLVSGPSPATTSGSPSRLKARTAVSIRLWGMSSERTR